VLSTDQQKAVLMFIHSLLPPDPEAEIRAAILNQLIPALQKIQAFHDGLPSAVYAGSLLRSAQALSHQYADSALGQILQKMDQSLSLNQRWGGYTVEYYQTLIKILFELIDRPSLTAPEIQAAIKRIEQISETMTQPVMVTGPMLKEDVEAERS
jgi:hypothetical protein